MIYPELCFGIAFDSALKTLRVPWKLNLSGEYTWYDKQSPYVQSLAKVSYTTLFPAAWLRKKLKHHFFFFNPASTTSSSYEDEGCIFVYLKFQHSLICKIYYLFSDSQISILTVIYAQFQAIRHADCDIWSTLRDAYGFTIM